MLASCDETVKSVFDELDYEEEDESAEERFTNLLLCDFIYEQVGSIPKKGDSFEYKGLKIRVEEVDQNRVLTAKIVKLPKETEKDKKDEES